jgi:Zinc-binding dehydrogenase
MEHLIIRSGREIHCSRTTRTLAEAGKLKVLMNPQRFMFETAMEAHLAVESGVTTGKVVIEIGE